MSRERCSWLKQQCCSCWLCFLLESFGQWLCQPKQHPPMPDTLLDDFANDSVWLLQLRHKAWWIASCCEKSPSDMKNHFLITKCNSVFNINLNGGHFACFNWTFMVWFTFLTILKSLRFEESRKTLICIYFCNDMKSICCLGNGLPWAFSCFFSCFFIYIFLSPTHYLFGESVGYPFFPLLNLNTGSQSFYKCTRKSSVQSLSTYCWSGAVFYGPSAPVNRNCPSVVYSDISDHNVLLCGSCLCLFLSCFNDNLPVYKACFNAHTGTSLLF